MKCNERCVVSPEACSMIQLLAAGERQDAVAHKHGVSLTVLYRVLSLARDRTETRSTAKLIDWCHESRDLFETDHTPLTRTQQEYVDAALAYIRKPTPENDQALERLVRGLQRMARG